MTRKEKQAVKAMPAAGVWYTFGGVELKAIEYGVNDYALIVVNPGFSSESVHRVKVCCDSSSRDYIRVYGRRLYFCNCERVWR